MSNSELPLFPLGRAVLPGARLKLQLFEQRYLKLIRKCLADEEGFGIVGLKSGGEAVADSEFYSAGCRVRIDDWDQLQNGLLGISVSADQPFVVKTARQNEDGLWLAEVEWLRDDWPERSSQSDFASDYRGLIDLYESLAAHSGAPVNPVEDAAILGWAIASILPLSNEDFSELLMECNPLKRLECLALKIDQLSMR
ncbi:MAG: ATP-dependent protease La domain-containing protein [Porticoccaceae bacterium]|jgi:uncharacterized protein|nr:ATP-dependent protease La domain-containing protein [Porticoccaceae bacterium]